MSSSVFIICRVFSFTFRIVFESLTCSFCFPLIILSHDLPVISLLMFLTKYYINEPYDVPDKTFGKVPPTRCPDRHMWFSSVFSNKYRGTVETKICYHRFFVFPFQLVFHSHANIRCYITYKVPSINQLVPPKRRSFFQHYKA
jgi:hypothetical protein